MLRLYPTKAKNLSARTLHPFPARMAPDLAVQAIRDLAPSSGALVLDPMCGSGTVLKMAAERGIQSVGADLDPLAVMMSRAATCPVEPTTFQAAAAEVGAGRPTDQSPPWHDEATRAFVEYWFDTPQIRQLNSLSMAIAAVEDPEVRNALSIALSRTIITKTPSASRAADTSHSRPHRVIMENPYDVMLGFARAAASLAKYSMARREMGKSQVYLADSRQLPIEEASIDLTVTSPPYLNAIDYMRGHRLSLIWLGYTVERLREIRANSIGAERGNKGEVTSIVKHLYDSVLDAVVAPEALPHGTLLRYCNDLNLFASEMMRVSRSGARIVTVMGNSTIRGNYIQNDRVLRDALLHHGFSAESRSEREIPQHLRYLPTREGTLSRRMRVEVVQVFRKI